MPVSRDFSDYVVDQLTRVESVTVRRMFGGLGIYARGVFFALADDDVLFFKVDDQTRPAFDKERTPPFRPYGPTGPAMGGYRELPPGVLDDVDQLTAWTQAAIGVALRARTKGKSPRKTTSTTRTQTAEAQPKANPKTRPEPRRKAKPSSKSTTEPTAKARAKKPPSAKVGARRRNARE